VECAPVCELKEETSGFSLGDRSAPISIQIPKRGGPSDSGEDSVPLRSRKQKTHAGKFLKWGRKEKRFQHGRHGENRDISMEDGKRGASASRTYDQCTKVPKDRGGEKTLT